MKSSDLEKFHRILRQSEFFYDFMGGELGNRTASKMSLMVA